MLRSTFSSFIHTFRFKSSRYVPYLLSVHSTLQTEGKAYAAFWWYWLHDSFQRLAGKAPLMVVDIDSPYPDPKQAPTNLKHFKRIERKIEECRPLSNNVRGRQMVEFKRRLNNVQCYFFC